MNTSEAKRILAELTKRGIIKKKNAPCEYCGIYSELRPYGKGEKWICYSCVNKPENMEIMIEIFRKQVEKYLLADEKLKDKN